MTSKTGKRLPPHYTVRTVRTVRKQPPATGCGVDDTPTATVRRPSGLSCGSFQRFAGGDGGGNGSAAGFFPSSAHTQGKEA